MTDTFVPAIFAKLFWPRSVSKRRRAKLRWLALMALVLLAAVSGCSPFYVMRAAYEEGKILWRREPISDFVTRPDIDANTKEKLSLVLAVREYAQDKLKLNVGGSYSTYSYVDRPDLTYVLTAAPKTELRPYTWWFFIVGRVPYKGYFTKEDAEAAAAELRGSGYDTNIRTSAAFSTLGWFNDPLLAHLLRYDKITLAEVVFHELFHNTLYVKGAGHFNESVANFVGGHAAIEFFRDKFGAGSAEHQQAIRNWEGELEFAAFIDRLANALTELYTKEIPYEDKLRLREEVFERFRKEWAERLAERTSPRFRGFAREPLNNAIVVQYLLYLKNLDLFEAVHQAQGQSLVETIDVIRDAVARGGDPFGRVQALVNGRNEAS